MNQIEPTTPDPQPQQQDAPERIWVLNAQHPKDLPMYAYRDRVEGGAIEYIRADLPRATAEADDWPTAKSIVRDWLMEKGVALSGVNGEVSRSSINRFKLDLQRRIVEAVANARAWSRSRAQKEGEKQEC